MKQRCIFQQVHFFASQSCPFSSNFFASRDIPHVFSFVFKRWPYKAVINEWALLKSVRTYLYPHSHEVKCKYLVTSRCLVFLCLIFVLGKHIATLETYSASITKIHIDVRPKVLDCQRKYSLIRQISPCEFSRLDRWETAVSVSALKRKKATTFSVKLSRFRQKSIRNYTRQLKYWK